MLIFYSLNLALCLHRAINSCPGGITPNSGLTGPNLSIYIYISIDR